MRTLLVLLATLTASGVAAQPGAWLPIAPEGDAVALTARHIFFDQDVAFSGLSSAHTIEGRFGVSPTLFLVGEVPTAFASAEGDGNEASAFVVGNPYLGLEAKLPNPSGRAKAGLGVRLPVVETIIEVNDDDVIGLAYGQFSNQERLGAFSPNTLTVVGLAEASAQLTPQIALVGQLTPQLLISTGDEGGFSDETEVLLGYVFRAEAQAGAALLTAGLRATGILTEEVGEGTDRFRHAFGIGAEVEVGTVRPGAFLEIPLSDDFEFINAIAGVGLTVDLD